VKPFLTGSGEDGTRPHHTLRDALWRQKPGASRAQGHRAGLRRSWRAGLVRTPGQRDHERPPGPQCQRRLGRVLTLAEVAQAVGSNGRKGVAAIGKSAAASQQAVPRGARAGRVEAWWHPPSRRAPLAFSRSRLLPNSRYLLETHLTGSRMGCGSVLDTVPLHRHTVGQGRDTTQRGDRP
jgi:hypothetical protein